MSRFVDTNVLLYSVGRAGAAREKQQCARALLDEADLVLSVQVLQEFYVQATRASRRDRLPHDRVVALMRTWRRYPIVDVTCQVLDLALELCASQRLSYWDGAIIAAAALAGCDEVLTEDMQHGAIIAGVRLRNPFL